MAIHSVFYSILAHSATVWQSRESGWKKENNDHSEGAGQERRRNYYARTEAIVIGIKQKIRGLKQDSKCGCPTCQKRPLRVVNKRQYLFAIPLHVAQTHTKHFIRH